MSKSRFECTPFKKPEVFVQSMEYIYNRRCAYQKLKWGIFHCIVYLVLFHDIKSECAIFYGSLWYWLECAVMLSCGVSSVYCVTSWLLHVLRTKKIQANPSQEMLLFGSSNNTFVTSPEKDKPKLSPAANKWRNTPFRLNCHPSFDDSYRSFNRISIRRSPSPNSSAMGTRSTPQNQYNASFDKSYNNNSWLDTSSINHAPKVYVDDEFMTDENSLNKYLHDVSVREQRNAPIQSDKQNMQMPSVANSFWNYCNNGDQELLKTSVYQLSPLESASQHKQVANDECAYYTTDTNLELIKRIPIEKLSAYVARLRQWLTITIFKRLVKEFETVNTLFRQRGILDVQIGAVGLERLRKVAEDHQFINCIAPVLPILVPFLDLSINQDYLVRRIKELAKGSCLSNYNWNSGSDYNGQKWGDHLPTDAAIVFHLFCAYMDSQLLPLPQGGGRPFYSRYIIVHKDSQSPKDALASVRNKARCAILCTNPYRPKFHFITDQQVYNSAHDCNSLFYVIIQFLVHMRTHQDSMLEGVNLGKSGINIMCVIED